MEGYDLWVPACTCAHMRVQVCLSEIVLIEAKSRVSSSIALPLTTFVHYLSLNLKLGIVVRPTGQWPPSIPL